MKYEVKREVHNLKGVSEMITYKAVDENGKELFGSDIRISRDIEDDGEWSLFYSSTRYDTPEETLAKVEAIKEAADEFEKLVSEQK